MATTNLFLLAMGGIALAEALRTVLSGGAGVFAAARAAAPLLMAAAVALWTAGRIKAAVITVLAVRDVVAHLP